ncbi:MBL fold metallo-hydrolase [Patescibacteria group bacterium]|nr:MBL fold metallo-hydrolase [Patescibacteria group bacterium]MBU1703689.1 MBL fold metallo-hydrolase [Patescibacteria group bacterium]MBU1953686.1 MBL fold metallo-hydrolase [Patescibacteria group bacterium]
MKIKFCGAAREVTGSRHLLEVNGKKIMLDCGLFQGRRQESDEKNREYCIDPKEIDVIILSHAHIDHSGGLPFYVKGGFKGQIFSTFATRDLCNYMLMDSAFIQEKDAEYMNKKNAKKGLPLIEPLYTTDDACDTLKLFYGVSYEKAFVVTEGVVCSFYDAGHILGSSLIHLIIHDKETDQRYTLAFTGDLGRKNLPILRDPQILPPADYLITECTYGDRFHESILDADKRLKEVVIRTVKRGGKILIPAFSVERTQEIVYHLNILWQNKEIPDVPIYVDSPLAANVTEVFTNHPECFDRETFREFIVNRKNPFGFGRLKYTRDVEESKALNDLNGPAIIISASGMCENGRILHHLKNNIEDPRNTIMVVGFMAQNTLGRKIVDGNEIVNIFGEPYHLRAEVCKMDAFSGHADRSDLLDYISRVEGVKKIFLVHGEEDQAAKFKTYLEENGYKDVVQPARGDEIEIP